MKKALLIIAIIAMFVSVALGVNAHPGKTDGKGGHTNRSTEEYHYHHGYSAHNHYDMDGDGKKDCPYDFRDNTYHSARDSIVSNDKPATETHKKSNSVTARVTFADVLTAMLEAILPSVAIGLGGAHLLSYLFLLFFGDDKGCSITMISFAVISIVTYILLIIIRLRT